MKDDFDDSDTEVTKSSRGESAWIETTNHSFHVGESSRSGAGVEAKESLHPLSDGFGAVGEHDKFADVGQGLRHPVSRKCSNPICGALESDGSLLG